MSKPNVFTPNYLYSHRILIETSLLFSTSITSMPLKASDSGDPIFGLATLELGSTATLNAKKQKIKVIISLLEEIKDINGKLINTLVDIDEDGVVKCTFTTVAFTSDLKSKFSQYQILPLRLLPPSNYPDCSPVLLDELPDQVHKGNEDLYFKIQEIFRRSLQHLSHPMSLEEMVEDLGLEHSCSHHRICEKVPR